MSLFGSDSFSSTSSDLSDLSSPRKTDSVDRELETFLMIEKQKAQFNAQVHEFNEFCWEKCMPDKLGNKVDSKTETCLNNCVDRFIDASLLISNRFATSLQKSARIMS